MSSSPSSSARSKHEESNKGLSYVTRGVKSSLYAQILASGFSSAVALFILNPIAVVRVALQNERKLQATSAFRICQSIVKREGLSGFLRGAPAGLLQGVPNTVIYMTCYESVKSGLIEDGSIMDTLGISKDYVPAIAGVIGRSSSVSLTSPVELLRTQQLSGVKGNLLSIGQNMVKTQGWTSLYRGLIPTLWRDVPFSAIYWYSFERARWPMRDYLVQNMATGSSCGSRSSKISSNSGSRSSNRSDGSISSSCRDDSMSMSSAHRLGDFGAGAVGGLVSALVTHPFDVLKTRRQVDEYAPSSRMGYMLRTEGLRGAFRGLWLRLATVIPGGAIMVTVYEGVKEYM